MKNICTVCSLNSSRSQVMEEFLRGKYASNPEININSAGLNVDILREDDKRTLFTKEMARETDVIFTSDHNIFYGVRYRLLKNDKNQISKVHLLRIPDVFHTHKNVFLSSLENPDYENFMQKIEQEPEFQKLLRYIGALKPRDCSELLESIYTKELYSAHLNPALRQDKKYPFELLHKTLEFRFSRIAELIENEQIKIK